MDSFVLRTGSIQCIPCWVLERLSYLVIIWLREVVRRVVVILFRLTTHLASSNVVGVTDESSDRKKNEIPEITRRSKTKLRDISSDHSLPDPSRFTGELSPVSALSARIEPPPCD